MPLPDPAAEPAPRVVPGRAGPLVFLLSLWSLWAYVCAVFLYRERVAGIEIGMIGTLVFFGIVAAVLAFVVRALARRQMRSSTRMLDSGFAVLSLLVAVTVSDTAYAVYRNWARAGTLASTEPFARGRDRNLWHGELLPRVYQPATEDFSLFKPNVRLSADVYGDWYHPTMLASPVLRDSVLEPRHVTYYIGPLGLRELEPLATARIFALGDSFVFGFATEEGKVWTDILGASLGEPIYNLGMSGSGPKAQLELLKHLLRVHGDSMQVKHLLWMIFEGNDLENEYQETAPASSAELTGLLEGTVLQSLVALPGRLKQQSILRQLVRGELSVGATPGGSAQFGLRQMDGVKLGLPLFRSERWGYRFFIPDDLVRATKPKAYVLEHPNRRQLDGAFREMRDLSAQRGFSVTVIVAPSDARLYGTDFEGFPTLSDRPHVVEYVLELAGSLGFQTLNLQSLLRPFADKEMLYYRDDHHWNPRGNEVVAGLIRDVLAKP